MYLDARTARIRTLLAAEDGPELDDLERAAASLEELPPDGAYVPGLTAALYEAALQLVRTGAATPDARVLGCPLTEPALRRALERTYRAQARTAATDEERIRLVDAANRVRPRTWW